MERQQFPCPSGHRMSQTSLPGRLPPFSALNEPLLAFSATDDSHVDTNPLRGLTKFSGYSTLSHASCIRLATVGPESNRDSLRRLLNNIVASHRARDRAAYVPDYPGFKDLFGLPLAPAAQSAHLPLPERLEDLGEGPPTRRVRNVISEALRQLALVRSEFDVAVVHLPECWVPGLRAEGFDAHDEIKAIGAELGLPTQVINDNALNFGYIASISWRLAIALYAKAGGTPWRLARLSGVPANSAYIGLAYALRGHPSDARFVTCCSQMFDSDGGGMQFVAYDAQDPIEDSTEARRNPYLSRDDMRSVLARSLRLYQSRNGGGVPQRVVIHKTTPFRDQELAGVSDALSALDEIECIEVTANTVWRGVRILQNPSGATKGIPDRYPVHRGTMIPMSGTTALLWAAGDTPSAALNGQHFFQGGKSIPSPLLLTRHMGEGPLELIASEILALTKMDWNNDALYNHEPVTISYSQRLARIIANVPDLPRKEFPYRLFM